MGEVTAWLERLPESDPFRRECDAGKMFGVLVVAGADGRLGYLSAFSGQVCGGGERPGFVPLIFDYLQPEGYFMRHEKEIETLGAAISHQQKAAEQQIEAGLRQHEERRKALQKEIDDFRQKMTDSKLRRDAERRTGGGDEAQRIRESQYQKAELRRLRMKMRLEEEEWTARLRELYGHTEEWTVRRKRLSDDLQHWLFREFRVVNGRGEWRSLIDVYGRIPPSGSGECCEPKLLQYAYANRLKPLCMAMMWWGESPRGEVRHHGAWYPACNAKCKPLLGFMLQGIAVEDNQLLMPASQELPIVYEDEAVCVVCKPAGMLSVPGKSNRESVYSRLRLMWPHADTPIIVHRLDMQTSGLIVTAKTFDAYHELQRQFANHEIQKTYIALLEPAPKGRPTPHEGRISLPLRPDLDDRPRQLVDPTYGREAITDYRMLDDSRIELHPLTGRTHQLRVHCASSEGLSRPIIGDELYGHPATRLFLHAAQITFRHPVTGEWMTFRRAPEFKSRNTQAPLTTAVLVVVSSIYKNKEDS